MSDAVCDEIREAAHELALGVLDGEERARVLAHVRGCPACRTHLDDLAVVAQEILTAAPVHEPPPGFESRVLDALRPAGPRAARRRRRWPARPRVARPHAARPRAARPHAARRPRPLLPAIAAAALLAAGGAMFITLSTTREERRLGAHYREVLARAGGKYLAAAELRDAAGGRRGVVFAYQGDQPWVTVVLAAEVADEPWRVQISTRAGAARELGGFDPASDGPVWGHALPVAVREVAGLDLTGADGGALRAQLRGRRGRSP